MVFRRSRRAWPRRTLRKDIGLPKYENETVIGSFTIIRYMGHSDVNKRNNHIMAKPQHWYRCKCKCGQEESRSQQELTDKRRKQKCFACRAKKEK